MSICCFDIGGTSIKYGVVNTEGVILKQGNFPTPRENCKKTVPQKLIEYSNELKKEHEIESIGISTAGYVDNVNGIVTFNLNLPDYSGCRIAELVKKGTGIKTHVENDANAAALGEMWLGAGKKYKSFACITIGTGIGGAIILNRKLYVGSHGFAGEMGDIRVASIGKGLGVQAAIDNCASTRGLLENYRKITGNKINGIELMELVKNDGPDALKAYNEFLDNLITGIINVVDILDTEAVVIGGGISAQGDFFFNKLNKVFKNNVLPVYKIVNIVKAELENDAGLLGACYIAKNNDYFL
jgi:glucokinase